MDPMHGLSVMILHTLPMFAVLSGFCLHVLLAVSVYVDARRVEETTQSLQFIGAFAWAVAAFLFGILGLLVYWLIHYSALSRAPLPGRGHDAARGAGFQREG